MKKLMLIILTFALFFSLFGVEGSALSRQCHSWYCMRAGNNAPTLEAEFSFIEEQDGYYLDKKAGEDDKVIYLTFDAGYENGNVKKIADILDKHEIKGCFFILENLIKREPELVKSMAQSGHIMANHTASHKDMTKICDIECFAAELRELEEIYRECTGLEMAKLYRPPEGKFSEENLHFAKELGYKTVFWSLAYADWDNEAQPDPQRATKLLLDNTHNGMVLLLHPTSATNAEILDSLICQWKAAGYRFGDVNELCEN